MCALRSGISCVLLSYKEAENLQVLLPRIREELEKTGEEYEIIVVDTAEPLDDTPEVCRRWQCGYVNQEEPGFGGAFRMGIRRAALDKFLILDSDGSHDPKYIPAIWEKFRTEEYDLVIGSRYVEGGETRDGKISVLMSHILNTAFRLCLGIKAHDISTDYRMYHTAELKAVGLENRNYDVLQEVLVKLSLRKPGKKLSIGEVPITFEKRLFGESKRRLLSFIGSYIRSLVKLTCLRYLPSASQKVLAEYGEAES